MKRVLSFVAALGLSLAGSNPAFAAPSLAPVLSATDWLNSPGAPADLAGKVVIVDVFTFDCINCKHVTPNLQHLHASIPHSELAILGVHTPELPEERVRANVVRELGRQGVVWPVAIDTSYTVWKALDNEYWPTQYIFDRHGTLRRTVVGEGQDDVVNATVKTLLAEH